MWLFSVTKGPHWKRTVTIGDKIPGFEPEAQGRVGGALRLDHPAKPLDRSLPGNMQWRGGSASLWFRVDALPAEKKSETILAAPFLLTIDAKGAISFAQGKGGKPASLGEIKPGEWHFVQLRSNREEGKVWACLDGQPERSSDASLPPDAALTFGSFRGAIDEVRTTRVTVGARRQAPSSSRVPFTAGSTRSRCGSSTSSA